MNEENKKEIIKKIVIERVKSMSPTVKIALGSEGKFLGKEDLFQQPFP